VDQWEQRLEVRRLLLELQRLQRQANLVQPEIVQVAVQLLDVPRVIPRRSGPEQRSDPVHKKAFEIRKKIEPKGKRDHPGLKLGRRSAEQGKETAWTSEKKNE
jgi:hypothetical protein